MVLNIDYVLCPGNHASNPVRPPHPIPYQGSKRQLAAAILGTVRGRRFRRLYEPFAGSAAITISAAIRRTADSFVISDTLHALVRIWERILEEPAQLADEYEQIWNAQLVHGERHFEDVRDRFNTSGDPAMLLYLLARCVKNSPRFNQRGEFNQSADLRRRGLHPDKMRAEILGAASLLRGKTRVLAADFADVVTQAGPADLVYMDPPWQGTSTGRDKRYHQGLERERLIGVLEDLNRRGVPFLLSYDGSCGDRAYGEPLPARLGAVRIELEAGRSSQSTLSGRDEVTVESLYVWRGLVEGKTPRRMSKPTQACLWDNR
ncbi:DNA adenine methylase [Myxococcota bacterium]